MGVKLVLALSIVAAPLVVVPFLHLGTTAVFIPFYPCGSRTVDQWGSYSYTAPPSATQKDVDEFHLVMHIGDPIPSGFVVSHRENEISHTTGVVDWLGRHEVEVNVTASADDLQSARLYLDDDLVDEATHENGGVVESSGEAKAVLRFFLPWLPPYTVRLVKVGADGKELESSRTVGRVKPPKPKPVDLAIEPTTSK